MVSVKQVISGLAAVSLIVCATVFITMQVAGVAELAKTVKYLAEELNSNKNVTRADSFSFNTALRGAPTTSVSFVQGKDMCTPQDKEIYTRDSAVCAVRDPFFNSCIETKFDVAAVHEESMCLLQPGMINLDTGKPDEAKFSACIGERLSETEGLSKGCATCFGAHSFTMCTQRKFEQAAEVCKTDLKACADILLGKCFPDLQQCTGMTNVTMPMKKQPRNTLKEFNNYTAASDKRSKSQVRKDMMDNIKVPSAWFPEMSPEKRAEWNKLFPEVASKLDNNTEHPIEEVFA